MEECYYHRIIRYDMATNSFIGNAEIKTNEEYEDIDLNYPDIFKNTKFETNNRFTSWEDEKTTLPNNTSSKIKSYIFIGLACLVLIGLVLYFSRRAKK